jgi:hypothetical protein
MVFFHLAKVARFSIFQSGFVFFERCFQLARAREKSFSLFFVA